MFVLWKSREILFLTEPSSDDGCESGGQSNIPDWDSNGDELLDNLNDYQNNGSITSFITLDGTSFGSSALSLTKWCWCT